MNSEDLRKLAKSRLRGKSTAASTVRGPRNISPNKGKPPRGELIQRLDTNRKVPTEGPVLSPRQRSDNTLSVPPSRKRK